MTAIICGVGEQPAVAPVIRQPKYLFLKLLEALNHHAGLAILGNDKRIAVPLQIFGNPGRMALQV
jgi:hypothetical protein